ncbi:PAS domain S-box protein [Caenimonas koreensis]|uniref:PAS domain-containing sensor histidine kinase n=1 Tax=Caenimonas koreensis TaxID=367474 RepID=UPI003784665B
MLNLIAAALGDDPSNASALLAGLLDSAMDAIITVDSRQRIVLCNRAAERLFGWPREQLLGEPIDKLIPVRFRATHAAHITRFGATGVTSRRMGGVTAIKGMRANGEEFPMDASISHLDTPNGHLYTVILRDITVRVLAEERHVRLSARLAGLLDSAMDGIITVDEGQRIVMYNRAAERIFGWPPDEAIGQPLGKLMPERFRQAHGDHIRRFGEHGVTSRRMGDGRLIMGRRADGEEFPMDASISQLDTVDGKLFTVILRDATERVRAQEERSEFAVAAQAIREEEKTRVARELHDELAQSLTALKMDTIWIREHARQSPEETSVKITGMLDMLDRAVASTRRIAADLRPLLLDDLGLGPAIDWLATNFTQRSGVKVVLDVPEDLDLREPYATAVFRIVQESLQNIAKHAQAHSAAVSVTIAPHMIRLEVRDDGKGFSPTATRRPESLGLMGLQERAQLLKGSVEIDSAPGRGTSVVVRIPVNEQDARA